MDEFRSVQICTESAVLPGITTVTPDRSSVTPDNGGMTSVPFALYVPGSTVSVVAPAAAVALSQREKRAGSSVPGGAEGEAEEGE